MTTLRDKQQAITQLLRDIWAEGDVDLEAAVRESRAAAAQQSPTPVALSPQTLELSFEEALELVRQTQIALGKLARAGQRDTGRVRITVRQA
ncbi:MAG: hypothetical protein ACOC7S_00750 [Planctomycetota bacterium]